jgi:hypothetical protein
MISRQALSVYCNTETCSCKYCCYRKVVNITYSGSVFVALSIQHEVRMRHIVIYGLLLSKYFFHIIS